MQTTEDKELIEIFNTANKTNLIKIKTVKEAEQIYNQLPDNIVYNKEKFYDLNALNNVSDIELAKEYLRHQIARAKILRLRNFFCDKGYTDKEISHQDDFVAISKMIDSDNIFKINQSERNILKRINKEIYNVEEVGNMIYPSIYSAFMQMMQSILDVDCRKKYLTETFF